MCNKELENEISCSLWTLADTFLELVTFCSLYIPSYASHNLMESFCHSMMCRGVHGQGCTWDSAGQLTIKVHNKKISA